MEGSSSLNWRTPSRSGNNGGQCVEVADATRVVLVRDTKNRTGQTLAFTAQAWQRFTASLR